MKPKPKKSDADEIVIRLCQKDAEFILELLEHPPEPSPRLREALNASRKAFAKKGMPDFAANLKGSAQVGQKMIQEIIGDSDLLMRHLNLSSRLRKALDLARATDLPVSEFCRRFRYPVLRRYRGFNQNTVAEIVGLLYRNTDVAQWLRTVPENIRRIAEGVLRIEEMATGRVKGRTEGEIWQDKEPANKERPSR